MWDSVIRLSAVLAQEPGEARAKAPGRPHDPAALAELRRLIETSTLSYRAIARATGVPRATISRHVLEGGWIRPQAGALGGEPPPLSAEGKRRARRGRLAERVLCAAEQLVHQIEMNPRSTPAAFTRAYRILTLAQRLDRPGIPRSRLSRAKRVKVGKAAG